MILNLYNRYVYVLSLSTSFQIQSIKFTQCTNLNQIQSIQSILNTLYIFLYYYIIMPAWHHARQIIKSEPIGPKILG